MKASDLPDKQFKIMVIKILTEIRRTIHEQGENLNKDIENIKIIELKNPITKLKNYQ